MVVKMSNEKLRNTVIVLVIIIALAYFVVITLYPAVVVIHIVLLIIAICIWIVRYIFDRDKLKEEIKENRKKKWYERLLDSEY